MNLRLFYVLFFGVFIINVTGCNEDDVEDFFEGVVEKATLSEEVIDVNEEMATVSFKGGKSLNLNVGIGSGAFHYSGDPVDEVYTITDRGPTLSCNNNASILGSENFCLVGEEGIGKEGRVFLQSDFTPTIYKLNVNTGGLIGSEVSYKVVQTIKIKDSDDNFIHGLPNPSQATITERGYDKNGNPLDFDPESIDPEAIIKLSNGTFWIAEEYAPSLIHLAANGRIMERIVPIGIEQELKDANYRIISALPAILKKRPLNRGIESLAISPDEQFLYFIMESPLYHSDDAVYQNSRYVRLFKLSLQNGDLDNVVGEYVYMMEKPETFTADDTDKQSDVKISEMLALDTDRLIILERVTRHTKLYRVSTLDDATNILGTEWDIEALSPTSPSLETLSNLANEGITSVGKKQVFDSRNDISDLDFNIEGITLLNNEFLMFINDNEFGINGVKTRLTISEKGKQLNQ
ncbi:esterase-like activity of phytase family protein [Candidatus Parabeggiatoa sp. HSG14]|uniref:esterase-like activity of phytase family protein n=1 Tax=Candidatus Parabeggiatoa sp. HSG14 TaxID=3055593 RepID=UPI0025A8EC3B|nr:esterase-like activity of phytase family protein [Thiotrichales bacterium HSG14]